MVYLIMDKRDISKVMEFCAAELGLPMIPIKIHDEGQFLAAFSYGQWTNPSVRFVANRMTKQSREWQNKSLWNILNYKPRFKWEYPFMIIAHEMSHYFQYMKHPRWLATYVFEAEDYLQHYKRFSIRKYNKLKVEANANKIALILLKRAKKKGFRLDI